MPYRINAITGELDFVDTSTLPPSVPTSFVTDAGVAVPVANTINFLGTAAQGISSAGVGDTVTYTVADGTTAQKGVARLATNAESIAGALTTNIVINPGSLGAKLGAQTAKGIPYGMGSAAALAWTAALTDGQLVIGSTAGNPAAATLSEGTGIDIAIGSNSITISFDSSEVPSIATTFAGDSGTATPALNVLTISGGTGLTSSAAGSTVTINLDTPVVVTNGGLGLSSVAQGDLLYGSAANTYSLLNKDTNATRYLSNTGASNNPAWAQINLSNGVTGVLSLINGGTGSNLVDPNADRILFWDDSAGSVDWLTAGSGLSISGTTITATATGDVVGPASATDNAITRFDGTTGKLLQNSVPTIDDTGNLSISASVSGASLSSTIANTSNTASATAFYNAQVAGGTASDAYYKAEISGGQAWTLGLDNSDSDAFVLSASGTPGTTNVMKSTTAGQITFPLQPCFNAYVNSNINNVTGNGTQYEIVSNWTENFDIGGNFSAGVFTAPITGIYSFEGCINMQGLTGLTLMNFQFLVGGDSYYFWEGVPIPGSNGRMSASGAITVSISSGTTVSMRVQGQGAVGDTADVSGQAGPLFTYFSGSLIG